MTCRQLRAVGEATPGTLPEHLVEHVGGCPECADERAAVLDLVALAEALDPPEIDARRAESARSAVIAIAMAEPVAPSRARRWPWAVAAATLLAVGAGIATSSEPERAAVVASGVATFEHTVDGGDERVELAAGRIRVEVEHLDAGERFRVITVDAEVEVRGTAFDVVARRGELVSVHVHEGVVDVRWRDAATVVLRAGESWSAPRQDATPRELAPRASAVLEQMPPALELPEPPGDEVVPAPAPRDRPAKSPVVAVRSKSSALAAKSKSSAVAAKPKSRVVAVSSKSPAIAMKSRSPALAARSKSPVVATKSKSSAIAAKSESLAGDSAGRPRAGSPTAAPGSGPVVAEQAATFEQGWAAMRVADYGEALRKFDATPSGVVPAGELAYAKAVAAARARHPRARALMRRYLDEHPDAPRRDTIAVALGWLLLDDGRTAEARALFESALPTSDPAVRRSAQAGLRAIAGLE